MSESIQKTIRIVMAQINLHVGDLKGNADQVIQAVIRARDELKADLVIFPELTLTGYPPEDLLLRPGFHMQVLRALEQVRHKVRGIDVVLGYPDQTLDGTFNSAALIQEGEISAIYNKQHLPNYSVFDERRYFAHGSNACVANIKGVPVGITICEDIWSPEPVRQAVEAGARLIINLNASPFHLTKENEREEAVRQRIEECGVPIIYVNLVGGQDELVFDGVSFVMNGEGKVTRRCPAFEEGLFSTEFEISGTEVRPIVGECVTPLSIEQSAYNALVLGVKDYVDKNGFKGVVIGLSGGIDSALTLAVAVDALGKDRVEAVSMPSRYTADMSIDDARQEAEALGIAFRVIPIETVFDAFLESLEEEFAGTDPDTTEENIQARCRGVLLMAISNKKRKIVLTTGNKSEMAVGYATLYGDMAGGFDVLKDVPKILVYRLAKYRNSVSAVIPERVIERPPSAELAPDQKDEDSLPAYEVLDPILEMYVEQDKGIDDIVAAGFDQEIVKQVISMVDRNEYKRRQAPPGVRITRRAFGRDRRYPITSGFTEFVDR